MVLKDDTCECKQILQLKLKDDTCECKQIPQLKLNIVLYYFN